jgi:hypothetical protein
VRNTYKAPSNKTEFFSGGSEFILVNSCSRFLLLAPDFSLLNSVPYVIFVLPIAYDFGKDKYFYAEGRMMKKKKGKFFVVEVRRLIPLVFLLVLLLSLTVYDNFFRAEQVVAPPEEPGGIMFTTTDSGIISSPVSFHLVTDYEEWARVSQDMGLALPDYPFNAAQEIAVFAVNGEIQNMDVLPALEDGVDIRVEVEPKEKYFHVITVDRRDVDHEGAVWNFVDNENRLLSRIVPFWERDDAGADGEEEDVEAEEEIK